MKALGKLERVDLRSFWSDEAREFTPWLAQDENLRLLGETVGMDLELEATEASVGAFKADIVAREIATENRVIIENQLERTDHDHLGKLITYASGLSAKTVIWIAAEINPEHRRALDWLNDVSGEDFSFFGLEIELWRIGTSLSAPKFNLVCQPNEWAKTFTVADVGEEPTETKLAQLKFWQGFVDFARSRPTILSPRKPRPQNWYTLAIGRSRFQISLTAHTKRKRIGCELYIRHRQSKSAFSQLLSSKEQVERDLGASLEWQELPQKRDCRIVQYRVGDINDRDSWPELHAWLLERAEAFHRAFSRRVRALELDGEDDEEDEQDIEKAG